MVEVNKPDGKTLRGLSELLQFCQTRNVKLSDEMNGFVQGLIASGKYPRIYSEEEMNGVWEACDELSEENDKLKKELKKERSKFKLFR